MIKIALCQNNPQLYGMKNNTKKIISTMEYCKKQDCEVVVFPELSLTGFSLGENVKRVVAEIEKGGYIKKINAESQRLGLDVIIGYPFKDGDRIYNAIAYIEKGVIKGIHKKIYLANYGHCNEHLYFSPGNKITCIDTRYGKIALLISEDAWHLSTSLLASQLGANIIFICSATSVLDKQSLYKVQFAWETINTAVALSQTVFVVYNNRYGIENELSFWGGSHVLNCDGSLIAKGKIFAEDIIFVQLDLSSIESIRENLPLIKNENNCVTYHHLAKILKK